MEQFYPSWYALGRTLENTATRLLERRPRVGRQTDEGPGLAFYRAATCCIRGGLSVGGMRHRHAAASAEHPGPSVSTLGASLDMGACDVTLALDPRCRSGSIFTACLFQVVRDCPLSPQGGHRGGRITRATTHPQARNVLSAAAEGGVSQVRCLGRAIGICFRLVAAGCSQ